MGVHTESAGIRLSVVLPTCQVLVLILTGCSPHDVDRGRFWPSLEIFRGRVRQWATEGGGGRAEFPFWPLFFLACLSHCQWVHAELGLGPGRGQRQGGPSLLPAWRRPSSPAVSEPGRPGALGCLPYVPLAGKALGRLQSLATLASQADSRGSP